MVHPAAEKFIRLVSVIILGLTLHPERANGELDLTIGDTIPHPRITQPIVRFLNTIDTLKDEINEAGKLSITKPSIKHNYFLKGMPDSVTVTVDSNLQN